MRTLFLMLLIFLLTAAVRILNIDGPALWTDEGFTYYTFKIPLFDALLSDRHPPFYFYTLHGWVKLAGDSILAMRYWSFLPSMLSVAVAYQLGRELIHHRSVMSGRRGLMGLPVLAALMMALADGENYLAQELRMYTWHVLFAAMSTLFYLKFVRAKRQKWALWWIIANALLIHTHYFGAFVLVAQAMHALIFLRGFQRRDAFAALVATGILFLPWFLGVTLRQFDQDRVCINCPPPDNWARLLEFREFWFGQQWPLTMAVFALGLVTLSFADGKLRQVRVQPVHLPFLLIALIVIPVTSLYALGHTEVIFFAHRLTQITVPIVLLLALGLANLPLRGRLVIVAAMLLYGVTTVDWYRVKVPWHEVTDLVAEYAMTDELVFAEVGPEESALMYYLDHQLPPGIQTSTFPFWGDKNRFNYYEREVPAMIAAQPERQAGNVTTAWLIYFSKDTGYMRHLEDSGYVRTMTRIYDHVDDAQIQVYRYDLLPQSTQAEFESGMMLRAVEIHEEQLRVDLWWSSHAPLQRDYVVSAFLLDDNGVLVAQWDAQPANNQRPTRTWQPGEVIYDPHVLQLVEGINTLPPGEYTVGVKVYAFAPDGSIENIPTSIGDDFAVVGTYFHDLIAET